MKPELIVNNSYAELKDFPQEIVDAIDTVLTVHNDIELEKQYLQRQIKFFGRNKDSPKMRKLCGFHKKKLKDLLASEFVHWLRDGKFPTGHLNIVKDVIEVFNVKYTFSDLRRIPQKQYEFILCKPFHDPRYYQKEIHEIAMREGRGVVESAVGTGKTDMLMRLIFELGVVSLIVVPSKPLLKQLEPLLKEHFGRRNVIRLGSEKLSKSKLRKVKKTPIRLINIQSLAAARKKGNISDLISDVDAIFIDEIHHAGSKSYTDLMTHTDHIYHRFGFTGTFLRNDSKTLDMWGFLSNKLYSYPAWKAIEDGFLTPVEVILHEIEGVRKRFYQGEYTANYCGTKKKYPEALLGEIKNIFDNYVKPSDQVLILVNLKDKCGAIIHEFLDDIGVENTYISGDSEEDEIDDAIREFNAKTVKVLIGSRVIGEGIDIRTADHLIMAQGGKSEIAMVQAAGRLVRLSPGKKVGYLHDFLFRDTKYMEKHWKLRKTIYKNNLAPKFTAA